ncbi:MAG: M14 family zinc carboxypeptidase [Rhodospirillaceae bacterium]|nr:M14 family zinc carboxypeptidase [Rhodospirillaceae bacterium]
MAIWKFSVALVAAGFAASAASAAEPVSYYLPADEAYDPDIPTPEAFMGHAIGAFVVRPDIVVAYARELDRLSERITSEVIGYSHEMRPIVALTVTSPDNHARLDAIRARHLTLSDPTADADIAADMPVVTWMGFGVHGDEISSMDAAMLAMYHLTAASSDTVATQLSNSVILLLPNLNPDGFGRAAQWVNMHVGKALVTDDQSREHAPGWPRGRGNHYWFDLNRQWIVQTQPEPQAWLALFKRWKPSLAVDFHEMNADSTYFFSPGIATQVNPYIGARTRELQKAIAGRFAATLDEDREFYFSEEFFDEFNPSMGSNFPAINGAVGFLFENRGFVGRAVENETGTVTLDARIRRHLRMALATVAAAADNRETLHRHQQQFWTESMAMARGQRTQAYVFAAPGDPVRAHLFLEMLARHEIRAYPASRDIRAGERVFAAAETYVVPLAQPQYRVIQNIFETRTQFDDVVFYDVSTWNVALAYGLDVAALQSAPLDGMAGKPLTPAFPAAAPPPSSTYAYAFAWDGLYAPRAVGRILGAGGRARVATEGFTAVTSAGPRKFDAGAIVVPVGEDQPLSGEALHALMVQIASADGVPVSAVPTGSTGEGRDLGSNLVIPLEMPKPVLVTGDSMRVYDAGELWYLLDRVAEVPTSMRDAGAFRTADLRKYTHIIASDGGYGGWGEDVAKSIDAWVRAGGVFIGTKRAALWAIKNGLVKTEIVDDKADAGLDPLVIGVEVGEAKGGPPPRRAYGEKESIEAAKRIRGAIFPAVIDPTHPIGFGYRSDRLAVFRDSRIILARPSNPFATVVGYTDAAHLSGFVAEENLKKLPGTAAVIAERRGRGSVILFADDPFFRAYWHGTGKMVLNALYFGRTFMPEGQRIFGEHAEE